MALKSEGQTIFSTFKSATKKDWINVATKELNGSRPDEKLSFSSEDLKFFPYYDKSDTSENSSFSLTPNEIPFLGARAWRNTPKVHVSNVATANASALDALNNGADGILFDFRSSADVDLKKLLKNIDLQFCDASFFIHKSSTHLSTIKNYFGSTTTNRDFAGSIFFESDADIITNQEMPENGIRRLGIIVTPSDPVQELTLLFNRLINIADVLTENRWTPRNVFSHFAASVSSETNFFFSIAKFKAIQLLWRQILATYGVDEDIPLTVHAMVPATSHDNMLKNTTAAMSAILGGCAAITVEPEDASNPRMVRIARNVSNILREESHLSRVADPTAGSYYIDSLVNTFANGALEKIKQNA